MKRVLILFFLFSLATISSLMAQQSYMEVTAPGRTTLNLAIAPPVPLSGAAAVDSAREISDALHFDLSLAGPFAVLPGEVTDTRGGIRPGEFDYGPWRALSAELLIKSGYQLSGENLVAEFRLMDVKLERELLAKRYTGKRGDLRKMAHTFCNEVMQLITGEKGPFTGKIAFVSTATGNKEIYLMDFDGYNVQRLTRNGSINLNPDFAPDGREIIYTTYRHGNPDLYRRELFSGTEARVSAQKGLNATATYAPDGAKIALTLSKDGNSEIYVISKDGGIVARLTKNPAIDVSPAWSPDGSRLAFVSDRLGKPQVFVMNADGSGTRRLTTAGAYNVSPRWSPKGDRIVYCRKEGEGFQIYTISPDGKNDTRLTSDGNNEHPRWSPDGRFIAYSSKQGGREAIYVMRADGSSQVKVSRGKSADSHPVVSVNW